MRALAVALLALGFACADSEAGEPVKPFLLAVGSGHVCAKRRSELYCWGDNAEGQLGDGTTVSSQAPLRAAFDASDVVELAAANSRTCLRRRSGAIECWGPNEAGQIGDGTRDDSLTPLAAAGIGDARQLAAAARSTCALRSDRSVACWGNSPAVLSDQGSLVAQPIAGLRDVVELRAGLENSYCARGEDRAVRCIRFRDGAWTEPAPVAALAGASAIALSSDEDVCGLWPGREVLCVNLDSGALVSLQGSQ